MAAAAVTGLCALPASAATTDAGLSREALAAEPGYDRSVIAKAETGDRPPTPDVAAALQAELFPQFPDGFVDRLAMADRLTRIAEASERPDITIQVIPSENCADAGLSGGFNLASSDGGPDVLRMEAVEDVTSESRPLVRQAVNIFLRLQADALPREASRKLIVEASEQWKAQQT